MNVSGLWHLYRETLGENCPKESNVRFKPITFQIDSYDECMENQSDENNPHRSFLSPACC